MRTDSTTVLGCTPPDPYQAPIEEALPLACQPHLLHPGARREQMFGTVQEKTDGDRSCTVSSMALFPFARTQVGQSVCEAKEIKGQIACLVHCYLDQPFLSTTHGTCSGPRRRFSFSLYT